VRRVTGLRIAFGVASALSRQLQGGRFAPALAAPVPGAADTQSLGRAGDSAEGSRSRFAVGASMALDPKQVEVIAGVTKGIAWPVAILIVACILRTALAKTIGRLSGVEGPGGLRLLFEVRKVGNRLRRLESLTTDIYHITGEGAAVRDEVFEYVAEILSRVSPETAFEMKTELNKYHMPNLGVTTAELKEMLSTLGYYKSTEAEQDGFSDELSASFMDSLYRFQVKRQMRDADGIIGPKTLKLLTSEIESLEATG
jgi:hypothetical protein